MSTMKLSDTLRSFASTTHDAAMIQPFRDLSQRAEALEARIAELEAGQQSQPPSSTPSVLLPFSESEIERMGEQYRSSLRGTSVELVSPNMVAAYNSALRFANTKAVSIDKIMEAIIEAVKPDADLDKRYLVKAAIRERLSKLNT